MSGSLQCWPGRSFCVGYWRILDLDGGLCLLRRMTGYQTKEPLRQGIALRCFLNGVAAIRCYYPAWMFRMSIHPKVLTFDWYLKVLFHVCLILL